MKKWNLTDEWFVGTVSVQHFSPIYLPSSSFQKLCPSSIHILAYIKKKHIEWEANARKICENVVLNILRLFFFFLKKRWINFMLQMCFFSTDCEVGSLWHVTQKSAPAHHDAAITHLSWWCKSWLLSLRADRFTDTPQTTQSSGLIMEKQKCVPLLCRISADIREVWGNFYLIFHVRYLTFLVLYVHS